MASCKEEFKLKNFKFGYSPVKDFVSSPWLPIPVVITYRAFVLVYSAVFVPYGLTTRPGPAALLVFPVFFFYLTYWCYTTLMLYFIVALVNTIVYYVKQKKGLKDHTILKDVESGDVVPDETSWNHKLQWLLFDVASTMAVVISVFYWAFEYTPGKVITWWSFSLHAVNSLFVILEHMITSIPWRLLHVVYPILFSSIYISFTVLYWATIDTGPIYTKLDYSNNPVLAVGLAFSGIFIGSPLSHLFFYGLHRAKMYLVGKYQNRPTDIELH